MIVVLLEFSENCMIQTMKTDHVIVRQSDMAAECLNCGQTLKMELPVDLMVYVKANKEFVKVHKHCKNQKGGD